MKKPQRSFHLLGAVVIIKKGLVFVLKMSTRTVKMRKEALAMKRTKDMNQQQFFAEVVKIQSAVPGVEVKGSTREERIAHMKAIFAAARTEASGAVLSV